MGPDSVQWTSVEVTGWPPNFECQHKHRNLLFLRRHPADFPKEPLRSRAARSGASTDKIVIGDYESPPEQFGGHVWNEAPLFYLSLFIFLFPPPVWFTLRVRCCLLCIMLDQNDDWLQCHCFCNPLRMDFASKSLYYLCAQLLPMPFGSRMIGDPSHIILHCGH